MKWELIVMALTKVKIQITPLSLDELLCFSLDFIYNYFSLFFI